MKKKLFIAMMVLLPIGATAQDTIRIMTFNLYSVAMTSLEELGGYIKRHNPDIVALQEVNMKTNRADAPAQRDKNQVVELGYYADLLPIFARAIDYPTGGYYGLGFLSKLPIKSISNQPLPQVNKQEQRTVVIGQWEINGKPLTIANTHLCLDKKNREVQMRFIRQQLRRTKGAKFVCGDLNSTPEEGLVPTIFRNWTDALPEEDNTFSSWNPIYKYDWMLYENKHGIQVINAQVDHSVELSDHCPCIIDIVIP